jgi:hypothetical protein
MMQYIHDWTTRLVTTLQAIKFLACLTSIMSRKSNVRGGRNDGMELHVNVAADKLTMLCVVVVK